MNRCDICNRSECGGGHILPRIKQLTDAEATIEQLRVKLAALQDWKDTHRTETENIIGTRGT